MKRIIAILILAFMLIGCTGPKYGLRGSYSEYKYRIKGNNNTMYIKHPDTVLLYVADTMKIRGEVIEKARREDIKHITIAGIIVSVWLLLMLGTE